LTWSTVDLLSTNDRDDLSGEDASFQNPAASGAWGGGGCVSGQTADCENHSIDLGEAQASEGWRTHIAKG